MKRGQELESAGRLAWYWLLGLAALYQIVTRTEASETVSAVVGAVGVGIAVIAITCLGVVMAWALIAPVRHWVMRKRNGE